jgi:hypothetical protein
MSDYKRGTIIINGKRYGFYPDGTRYRLYEHRVPFLSIVSDGNDTFLRVRQATEKGYTDVPVGGCADLAYPNSTIRRSRTVGGGKLVNALTCAHQLCVFIEL